MGEDNVLHETSALCPQPL